MKSSFTHRCVLALLVAGSLQGCVSASHREPNVNVPATFQPYDGSTAADTLDRWWLLFNDSQLTELIDQGLAKAPDARTAISVLEEARATRSQTLSQYDPQGNISLGGSVQRVQVTPAPAITQQTYSAGFSPSWELDLFGRRGANRLAANSDFDVATFQYVGSRQALAANIAIDLFQARANAVRLEQARETLRIAANLARLGEKRVLSGIGSRADSASLEADEATAKAAFQNYQVQVEISVRTLLTLLGRGTEPIENLQISPELNTPPPLPKSTPATLLVRRPDIRKAEAQLRSSAANLKLDSLALLPTINLLPSASYQPIIGPGGYTTTLWSIGSGLTLPILNRHRLLAQVRGQRARTEQAVIAYENAVQSGIAEAQSNLSLFAADRARLVALERAEERAHSAFVAQQSGFRAGVVDLTTLLQSETTWRTNLAALSDLRAGTLIDSVNVFRALGGGWPGQASGGLISPASTKERVNP